MVPICHIAAGGRVPWKRECLAGEYEICRSRFPTLVSKEDITERLECGDDFVLQHAAHRRHGGCHGWFPQIDFSDSPGH